jgi:7,8-dihydropterin-6-yl-methyl-4-(beta-D-ribofuranosyl)aminobenzene 5'-phosphate synthase
LQLKVIYDNKSMVEGLTSDWGFSCLVGDDLLFNTGEKAPLLFENMAKLGIRPEALTSVVISHADVYHAGGLFDLLEQNPSIRIYLHPKFPQGFIANVRERAGARLMLVDTFTELSPDVYVTGPYPTREQALVIRGKAGLVVLTGCAQPNAVDILKNVQQRLSEPIDLVIGGLHLACRVYRGMEEEAVEIIKGFRQLGVKRVGPCHCTGEEAIQLFRKAYGDDFVEVGAGLTLQV